jgi:hypothetical protein
MDRRVDQNAGHEVNFFLPIWHLMGDKRLVNRTNILARAEACWLDSRGKPHVAEAMLEETSPHGACLRLNEPIRVGSKVTVKWMREQFSGTVRHSYRHDSRYVLGIERDQIPKQAPKQLRASSGKANI